MFLHGVIIVIICLVRRIQLRRTKSKKVQLLVSKRIKTSIAWDYFERFVNGEGIPKVKCKKCGKEYVARNDSGTSNMKKHAKKCDVDGRISSYPLLDQEKYMDKVVELIIKHGYPFSFVEHEAC